MVSDGAVVAEASYELGLPVPEPLGYDDDFEFVGFVEGDAGEDVWPHQLGLAGVLSAGKLLREVHDATRSWKPPDHALWSVPSAPGPVICHGDPKPGNMVWRQGQAVGLFDWDGARPEQPVDDVAYALLYLVPVNADATELERRGFDAAPDRPAWAKAFLDGYGWDEPIDVIDTAIARHVKAINEVVWSGVRGHEPQATWVAAGWPQIWRDGLTDLRDFAQFPN